MLFLKNHYINIKSCTTIEGIQLPNENMIQISGYADDTNFFTINNESIVSIFNVLSNFNMQQVHLKIRKKQDIWNWYTGK